jgi:predicted RNase H-like HicB family nuclease
MFFLVCYTAGGIIGASWISKGSVVKYPVTIEYGDDKTAHAIRIPDLQVSTAGDTIEDAYAAAVEAADIELRNFVKRGEKIPRPSTLDAIMKNPDFAGHGWGVIDIDITPYLGTTEKVTVTLPRIVITSIDEYVKKHNLRSRSAFLAETAMEKISLT